MTLPVSTSAIARPTASFRSLLPGETANLHLTSRREREILADLERRGPDWLRSGVRHTEARLERNYPAWRQYTEA